MSGINKKIVNLLEENRNLFEGKTIVPDGVVDEEIFLNTPIKTAFLLKEVNDPEGSKEWNLPDYIREQAAGDKLYSTWPNVCLWMETLRCENATFADCLLEDGSVHTKKIGHRLLETAVVNIKKTPGGGSSKHEELTDAINHYGHIVCREIEECIKPDLVICGGTFEYAKLLFRLEKSSIRRLPSGAEYFLNNGILYLQFVHPSWFGVSRHILFAYAKEVFGDVRRVLSH